MGNKIFSIFKPRSFKGFLKNPVLHFDRSFSSGSGKQIGWLLMVFLIVLGVLYTVYCTLPGEGSFSEKFSTLLFLLIDPTESDKLPVVFTVIVDILGLTVFGGMLISVVSNLLERRVEAYQNGDISYKLRHHIVIIGFNDSVCSLVKTLRTQDGLMDEETFIMIQSGQNISDIRGQLEISLEKRMVRNTIIVRGLSNSEEDIHKLNIAECQKVYIIGDQALEAHDSINLECLTIVAKLWRESHTESVPGKNTHLVEKLHCNVLFEHQTLYSIFQFSELENTISEAIHFHPFNLYENWAKKVLVNTTNTKSSYKPLEGYEGFRKNSQQHVHLIVIGMSQMGTALALETAQIAHFNNFKENDNSTRTHITFIDCKAQEKMEVFQSRFPSVFDTMRWRYLDATKGTETLYSLSDQFWINPIEMVTSPYKHLGPNFTDIQWEFVNGRVESASIRKYLIEAVNDSTAITTVAVCLPNTLQAIESALFLPNQVLRLAHQVLIYQKESEAVIECMNNSDNPFTRYNNIIAFGSTSDTYCNDFIGDKEGKWINAFWAQAFAPKDVCESYQRAWNEKDEAWAQRLWDGLSVSDKWSSIHCANNLYTKLRSIGCSVEDDINVIRKAMEKNQQNLVFTEHNRWVTEQLLAGFRPLLADEWNEYEKTKHPKNNAKRAHGNICSNKTLAEVEPHSHDKDWQVTLALLDIIKHNRK